MIKPKPALTPKEQITLLKQRNLQIKSLDITPKTFYNTINQQMNPRAHFKNVVRKIYSFRRQATTKNT